LKRSDRLSLAVTALLRIPLNDDVQGCQTFRDASSQSGENVTNDTISSENKSNAQTKDIIRDIFFLIPMPFKIYQSCGMKIYYLATLPTSLLEAI
jgi:hypothetical protein